MTMFGVGKEVEVFCGDGDGFPGGAYFAAAVVRTMPKLKKYTVQYAALVESDDTGRPLRETVSAARVRPPPPPVLNSKGSVAGVGPLRLVDAAYNDAWWVGFLVGQVGKGGFKVYFPATMENMVFEAHNVRPHLEWVEQEWMKPENLVLEEAESIFGVGTEVEVAEIKDTLAVGWFPAIIEKNIYKKCYLVKYKFSRNGSGSSLPEEIVYLNHIRPCPACTSMVSFCINDEIEAFHNGGWLRGVITEVHRSSSYKVKLLHLNKEIKVEEELVRLQYDWVDGQWVSASEIESDAEFMKGAVVEVSSDEEGFQGAWFEATIIKRTGQKFLVEYKTLKMDDGSTPLRETVDREFVRPLPPEAPASYDFSFLDEVDMYYNDGWWTGVISMVKSHLEYTVYFRSSNEEMEATWKQLRPHYDWIGGRWMNSSPVLKRHT